MRIIIAGPGALGCLLAAVLHKGSTPADDIMLLDHNSGRARLLNDRGILLESDGSMHRYGVPVCVDPAHAAPADVIFFCVKSYDIDSALEACAPLLKDRPLLVFLQNGIAHLKHRHRNDTDTLFATTTEGSTLLTPGHIRHGGAGSTFFGFLTPPQQCRQRLLADMIGLLRRGGLNVRYSDTILSRIWTKLTINVGINALTVIYDCVNGELLSHHHIREQMRLAVEEAAALALRLRIKIDDAVAATQAVCLDTGANISSMLQDVRRQRKTEIDAINGAVVRLGAEHGLAFPVNSYLVDRVKEREARYAVSGHQA